MSKKPTYEELVAKIAQLDTEIASWKRWTHGAESEAAALRQALGALLGHDDKMQVAIGGNPIYVDAFLGNAQALLSRAQRQD